MEPVGLWEWFWILLLLSIPLVNIIAMIIFASGNGKPSIVNFARASLVWFGIFFALGVIIVIVSSIILEGNF